MSLTKVADATTPDTENQDVPVSDNTEKCIVDELLTSAWHALTHSRTDQEIAQEFSLFYDDEPIKTARKKLSFFHTFKKRSDRAVKNRKPEARANDVLEILKALREIDWKAMDVKFTACNIENVYKVRGGIQDDLLIRNEINQLRDRLQTVEDLVKIVTGVSSKIDTISNALQTPNLMVDKVKVAYNDSFRLIMGYSRKYSASLMFSENCVNDFHAMRRVAAYSLLRRTAESDNAILTAIINSNIFLRSSISLSWKRMLFK
ncbi:unnamed protein product [Orchesella dallaii]|uniref:Uncharacterized protein n=1 Tax=Orchesella dallaii TaxID=48710 RepID=A0ABP1RTC8_9HEXA